MQFVEGSSILQLQKVLETYGYRMDAPRSGSSHYTFRKQGKVQLQYQKHELIKSICRNGKKGLKREKMKTLNEYMSMSYKMKIIEDQDEGGFVISYPDLPGCITCGETIESAMQNAKDKKRGSNMLLKRNRIYEPDSLKLFWTIQIKNTTSLHRSLAEHSQREGISMNQYCVYLLKNDVIN